MRMSGLFSQTLRDISADAEVASHKLLLRAGFVRQLASGIFSYLPLGHRALRKVEEIIRREMDAIGGQEITMPVVHPAEIWQQTGRWYEVGSEMSRFKDKSDRDMVLAMTHEEVVADLVSREVQSYLAREAFEIPLINGVDGPAALPSLERIQPPRVELSRLSELQPALELMRETGVL